MCFQANFTIIIRNSGVLKELYGVYDTDNQV